MDSLEPFGFSGPQPLSFLQLASGHLRRQLRQMNSTLAREGLLPLRALGRSQEEAKLAQLEAKRLREQLHSQGATEILEFHVNLELQEV